MGNDVGYMRVGYVYGEAHYLSVIIVSEIRETERFYRGNNVPGVTFNGLFVPTTNAKKLLTDGMASGYFDFTNSAPAVLEVETESPHDSFEWLKPILAG